MAPPAKRTKPHAPLEKDNILYGGLKSGVSALGGWLKDGIVGNFKAIDDWIVGDSSTHVNESAAAIRNNANKAIANFAVDYQVQRSNGIMTGPKMFAKGVMAVPGSVVAAALIPARLGFSLLGKIGDGVHAVADVLTGTTAEDNYGRGMSIRERQANRQAIGLLAGQYLALMTPGPKPGALANKSEKQDWKERNNFRQQLFASVSRNINYLPLRQDPTDLTKPPMSPIDTYMEAMVYATEGTGPDVHPLPTKTEGPIHPGLEKARNAIRQQQKQAAKEGSADALAVVRDLTELAWLMH
jgi:hypothetical protein